MSDLAPPLLEIREVKKYFTLSGGLLRPPRAAIRAVDGVSLNVAPGEVLALVGESGCGKSTLALTVAGLESVTAGEIRFRGQNISSPAASGMKASAPLSTKHLSMKEVRRQIQMIFQDPYESLNPLMSVEEIVAEPLLIHQLATNATQRKAHVIAALESAGLRPAGAFLTRHPHELSGGQRQRVVIASALVLEPALLLADEPVSMLDVSVRAEILNLLSDLQRTRGISVLFITHDLSTVATFADRIAVMYLGRIVELGPAARSSTIPSIPTPRRCSRLYPSPIRDCAIAAPSSAVKRPTPPTSPAAAVFIPAARLP